MATLEPVTDEALRRRLLGLDVEEAPEQGSVEVQLLGNASPQEAPSGVDLELVEDKELRNKLLASEPTPEIVEAGGVLKKEPTYLERMSALREKRIAEVSETFEDLANDEIGLFSGVLQTVGKGGFGAFLDFTGETIATAASAVTPDPVEDMFKDAMVQLYSTVKDKEVVKKAMKEWDGLDSNTKKNIESAANVLTVLLPKVRSGATGKSLKNAGEAVRKSRISDSLKLPDTSSNRVKEAQRLFRDPVGHKQMVDTVAKVKGYSSSNTIEKNLKVVGKEINNTEVRLQNLLRTKPKGVTPDEVFSVFDKNMKELLTEQSWITSNTAVDNAIKNNLKAVTKIVDKNGFTTEGLLKARREIDKLFNNPKKLQLPAEELTARDAITKVLRNSVNEVIDSKYPSGKFKDLLATEHQLLKARDILANKYGQNTTNVKKALSFVKQHPLLAGMSIEGGGMLMGLASNPWVVAGSTAGLAGYAGYRALPSTLKALGTAIETRGLPSARAGMLYGFEEEPVQPQEGQAQPSQQ